MNARRKAALLVGVAALVVTMLSAGCTIKRVDGDTTVGLPSSTPAPTANP